MKKTIAQIQYEMETVKLIKEAMEVDGKTAHKLFEEWTSDEPKVEEDVIQETLDKAFESIKELTINMNLNSKNLSTAKDLVEDIVNEMRKRGTWDN